MQSGGGGGGACPAPSANPHPSTRAAGAQGVGGDPSDPAVQAALVERQLAALDVQYDELETKLTALRAAAEYGDGAGSEWEVGSEGEDEPAASPPTTPAVPRPAFHVNSFSPPGTVKATKNLSHGIVKKRDMSGKRAKLQGGR